MLKTYTRIKPVTNLIENVESLCRLCLSKSEEKYPIFTTAEDYTLPLTIKIMQCVGLTITEENNISNMICKKCKKQIEKFYSFKKKCELTYQKLKSHQQALKDSNPTTGAVATVTNKTLEQSETQSELEPSKESLSEFLTKSLMDLRIISSNPQVEWLDKNISKIELSTGDGSQYTFELMEEEVPLELQKEPQLGPPVEASIDVIDINTGRKKKKSGGKKHQCNECGKCFVNRRVLARHSVLHSASRPYACSHCSLTFKLKAIWKRHQLVHQEQRPYMCGECGRGYTQRGGLESHIRTHSEHAPLLLHACTDCSKVFLHASGLSRHKSRHAGRSYQCLTCSRGFTDVSALRRHRRNMHPTSKQRVGDE